jgi:tripartite-type tricarboxylate transporter receptor subunit TctC
MIRHRKSILGAIGSVLVAVLSSPVSAAWPERTVTLVVPFSAGGITDILARMTAERLNARFKQPFIVENVVGAAGTIAAQRVARAEPDGHTLFFATLSQIAIAPYMNRITYDPVKDFKPISIIATSPFVITVGKGVPVKTLAEFQAYVKANPGKVTHGSAGVGSLTHLSAVVFARAAGIEMLHVPYRGIAPAFQDLLAGHIAMMSGSPVEVKPFIGKEGIKLLATTGATRASALPDVPTVSETLPKARPVVTWNGVMGPAATPQAIVDALSTEIMAAERDADFIAKLKRIGVDPIVHTPADFAKMIATDLEQWRETITQLGLNKSKK